MSNCSLSSKRARNFASAVGEARFSAEKPPFSLVPGLFASLRLHGGLCSFVATLSEFLSLARSSKAVSVARLRGVQAPRYVRCGDELVLRGAERRGGNAILLANGSVFCDADATLQSAATENASDRFTRRACPE